MLKITRNALVSVAKSLLPGRVLDLIRQRRHDRRLRLRRGMSNAQIFSEIYAENKWGGQEGDFCSGSGSTNESVVTAYVDIIERLAVERGFHGKRFVDFGCGDFRVGRRLLPLCSSYVGVDVVPALIDHNNLAYGNATTSFLARDLTRDQPPDGEVCFVRQVLQHLSNAEITAILARLDPYRWVFITEHQPAATACIAPNIDKVHGEDVRVAFGSGVFVDKAPFSLPPELLDVVLEVPGTSLGPGVDPGIIRTILYTPKQARIASPQVGAG